MTGMVAQMVDMDGTTGMVGLTPAMTGTISKCPTTAMAHPSRMETAIVMATGTGIQLHPVDMARPLALAVSRMAMLSLPLHSHHHPL